MIEVRPATTDDLPLLVEHGMRLMASLAKALPLRKPEVEELACVLLDHMRTEGTCTFVAEHDGKAVGAIAGRLDRAELDPAQTVARQVFLFVPSNGHVGPTGQRLLKAFETWARRAGASVAICCSLDCLEPRAGSLFARLGYAPAERYYARALT